MADRKPSDATPYRKRRPAIGVATDISFVNGRPIGSSNFATARQVGPGGGPLPEVSRPTGIVQGSSNDAASQQTAVYRGNVGGTGPRTVEALAPKSDGVTFRFLTGD